MEETIKKITQELVEKMGFDAEIEVDKKEQGEQNTLTVNIKTADSNYLIGQYGMNLAALQHIARLIVRKKIDEKINFILDVNSYRSEKNESVVELAKNMAAEALAQRRAVVMRPMSPYERRLVHLELSQNSKVKTESIGEGENRKVVIKPVDLI